VPRDRRSAGHRPAHRATALVGDDRGLPGRSSRDAEFASFLGLVPRQSGAGGKLRLGSISKRRRPVLRTLLIHGARSVVCRTKVPTAWQSSDSGTQTCNVATVALANNDGREPRGQFLAHGRAVSEGLRLSVSQA